MCFERATHQFKRPRGTEPADDIIGGEVWRRKMRSGYSNPSLQIIYVFRKKVPTSSDVPESFCLKTDSAISIPFQLPQKNKR